MPPPTLPDLAALLASLAQTSTRAAPEAACQGLWSLLGCPVALFVVQDGPEGFVVRAHAGDGDPASALNDPGAAADLLERLRAAVAASWQPGAQAAWVAELAVPGALTRGWSLLGQPVGARGALVVARPGNPDWLPEEVAALQAVAVVLGLRGSDDRRSREALHQAQVASALTELLELGVRAASATEAAEAVARAMGTVLELPVACGYLVEHGVITEVVVRGVDPEAAERFRRGLVGARAEDSPVWHEAVAGDRPQPVLIEDTRVPGTVRTSGVAQLLDLVCLAAIPLLSAEGPLGLVICGDRQPRHGWRRSDREVLERLALEGAVIVDNARLRARERFEALHDPLTGLANRRALADELAAALGAERSLTLALVDLDGFKEVNDTLGHLAGDQLLRCLAARLQRCAAPAALAARLGGDEFAVLLPGATKDEADQLVGCLRRQLALPCQLGQHRVVLSASIGVAEARPGDSPGELIHRADIALYRRKRRRPPGTSPRWLSPAPAQPAMTESLPGQAPAC